MSISVSNISKRFGIQEGDRVRLKPQRIRVFPAETATPLLAD